MTESEKIKSFLFYTAAGTTSTLRLRISMHRLASRMDLDGSPDEMTDLPPGQSYCTRAGRTVLPGARLKKHWRCAQNLYHSLYTNFNPMVSRTIIDCIKRRNPFRTPKQSCCSLLQYCRGGPGGNRGCCSPFCVFGEGSNRM